MTFSSLAAPEFAIMKPPVEPLMKKVAKMTNFLSQWIPLNSRTRLVESDIDRYRNHDIDFISDIVYAT